jgi:branched-chain amino acid transport system substrate-binding protein
MTLVRFARAAAACAFAASLCFSATAAAPSTVSVALITSKTGLLGEYGNEYLDGFKIGLAYATHGTGAVDGKTIDVSEYDDAGDPAKAVATFKDVVGQGTKIVAGTASSGVVLQLAPLAKENNVLYISGPAATDAVTGANRNTFRSGRQSYQDVLAAGTVLGVNLRGKKVLVLAQDSAFGQANVAAARAVLGSEGATVDALLVPLTANDFAPFDQKIADAKPDMLFVAWAGTTAPALFKSLTDSGVAAQTKVVTGLGNRAGFPYYGSDPSKIFFLSHYLAECCHNAANDYLIAADKKEGKVPDLFTNDGFVAAEMIVHAVAASGGGDVNKMISSLEGWKFLGPKGQSQIRAIDHAVLQPMFIVKLNGSGTDLHPMLLRTLTPETVAPPVKPIS